MLVVIGRRRNYRSRPLSLVVWMGGWLGGGDLRDGNTYSVLTSLCSTSTRFSMICGGWLLGGRASSSEMP